MFGLSEGDRIRLISMPEDPDPVPSGTAGTVVAVIRMQIQVEWDNGRSLMLLPDIDRWEKIKC